VAGASGRSADISVGDCGDPALQSSKPPPKSGSVPLFDETELAVRITPDRSLADFFVQGGRWSGTVAWKSKTPRAAGDSQVSLWASTAGVKADLAVHAMGCGWENPSYTEHPTM
jgi:hypothetical protein